MLVSVCWVGGFESEVQTNNSRGIHVCQRFFSISKQCDFIICDVLLERLSVRLAEGSYLLNLFYIFVLRKLRTANCMCSTVIHCYHWCFRKRTNAASASIIYWLITLWNQQSLVAPCVPSFSELNKKLPVDFSCRRQQQQNTDHEFRLHHSSVCFREIYPAVQALVWFRCSKYNRVSCFHGAAVVRWLCLYHDASKF